MNTITVAAAIIRNPQNQLLLVRKKNTDFFMQVGGKLEPNEAPEQTMLREIEEEIGAKAVIEQFIGRFETRAANEAGHQLISYVYQVSLDQAPKIDAEIAEMKWIDLDSQDGFLAPLTIEIVIPWCKENWIS
jgi:8-oxo-dGTP diphosphatase